MEFVINSSNLKTNRDMKNNIDYVPAVKNLLDSVFDTYLDVDNRTDVTLRKKRVLHELLESDKDFVLQLHVSGYTKEDFEIKVEQNQLIISSAKEKITPEGYKVLRTNVPSGQIYKVFNLNDKIEAENITASYEQGILSLTLPKSHKDVNKTIEIK